MRSGFRLLHRAVVCFCVAQYEISLLMTLVGLFLLLFYFPRFLFPPSETGQEQTLHTDSKHTCNTQSLVVSTSCTLLVSEL